MALGFDVPTIGLLLIAVGAIALVAAAVNRTGKQLKRGDAAIIGAVLGLAGMFMGGLGALAALSAVPGPVGPPTPGALWNLQITRVVFWDTLSTDGVAVTGGTGIIDTAGKFADIYAARADMDDAGAVLDIDVTMINLNQGDSTITWQIVMQLGAFDSVDDAAAGTSYPLVQPDNADPSIGEVTYVDVGATGSRVGALFYDVIATAGSGVTEAEISLVDTTPFVAMVVGQYYDISVVAGGETFPVHLHATA